MITSSFSGDIINVSLRQIGATSIKEVRNGIMYIAKFQLDDEVCVTYVFNVTKRDKYYLQRVEPYPISYGDFEGEGEVVEFITRDIRKFRNAMQSHNFDKFMEVRQSLAQLSHAVELMFLERNVPEDALDYLNECMLNGLKKMREIHDNAPRIDGPGQSGKVEKKPWHF